MKIVILILIMASPLLAEEKETKWYSKEIPTQLYEGPPTPKVTVIVLPREPQECDHRYEPVKINLNPINE